MSIIDELPDNLPSTEEKIENAFRECQKEKREVVKTRTYIEVSPEEYRNYLDSAIEALNAAKILLENHCYEWAIVPAYSKSAKYSNINLALLLLGEVLNVRKFNTSSIFCDLPICKCDSYQRIRERMPRSFLYTYYLIKNKKDWLGRNP